MGNILYSTNCPKCKVLEKKLNNSNIDFEINTNVDTMLELGFMSAPVLVIEGQEPMEFKQACNWIDGKG